MPKDTLDKIKPAKREKLLSEAAKLFAQRGYNQADMAELATRAGVAKGSLYNYFDSKQELLNADVPVAVGCIRSANSEIELRQARYDRSEVARVEPFGRCAVIQHLDIHMDADTRKLVLNEYAGALPPRRYDCNKMEWLPG